jgi:diguanylate cyclase (GGDEF)-like protein/PAS domain S-box-containing protein
MEIQNQIHILLIESNLVDAQRVQVALANAEGNPYSIVQVDCITDGLIHLRHPDLEYSADLIMVGLDSSLDEKSNSSLPQIDQLLLAAPNAIIIALAQNEDGTQKALALGAHEYLAKSHIHAYWLPRALRYMMERKQQESVVSAAEKALYDEKNRAHIALNSIGDAIITTDLMSDVIYINRAAEILLGCSREFSLGKSLADLYKIINTKTRMVAPNPALYVIEKNSPLQLDSNLVLLRPDGSELAIESSATPVHDAKGNVTGAVIIFHDVSASRTMALKMTHLAQHDFLTGLPNRMLLTERLSQAIGLAQRNSTQVALLFIDLDFFKHINDSLGHAVGDELLKAVSERMVNCVRATDTVCRQGGDEFVILLSEIERPQDAALAVDKLFATFSEPVHIGVHELHVSLSIGISIYPGDGMNAESLMQNADAAMYHAKALGRNNCQFFKMEMNTRAVQRAFIEASLRSAIKKQEFVLHYQPKIDIASGTIIGAEALIRWNDPQHGLIYPVDFLAIAEECGLIVPIGGWILREICNQQRTWLKAGLHIIPVSINVSTAELKHKYFLEGVRQVLTATGLPPYYLEFEFTETILMRDAEFSIKILEALKVIGVQLAIDDFGTGYSSLSYLQRFPVDTLKIDKSFMRDLSNDSDNATIVSAMIAMGRNLKQRVLAEGVETSAQLNFLRTHRCTEAQGFHMGPPLSSEDFSRILSASDLPALYVRQRTDGF